MPPFRKALPHPPSDPCWPVAERRAGRGAAHKDSRAGASSSPSAPFASTQTPDCLALALLPRTSPRNVPQELQLSWELLEEPRESVLLTGLFQGLRGGRKKGERAAGTVASWEWQSSCVFMACSWLVTVLSALQSPFLILTRTLTRWILLSHPLYRWGNWVRIASSRGRGQVLSFSVTELSVPGGVWARVSLRVKVTSCPLLLIKEVLFLLVAKHPRLLVLRAVGGLLSADLQTCIFSQGRDFCVYCLLRTGTYQCLNTKTSTYNWGSALVGVACWWPSLLAGWGTGLILGFLFFCLFFEKCF